MDVIPGNEEKDRDDSRDWSSDEASNLSMAANTRLHLSLRGWKRCNPASTNHREEGGVNRETSLLLHIN